LSENWADLVNNFSEILVGNFDSSNVNIIGIDFSLKSTSSEFNIEIESELLVVGELGSIVLLVVKTAYVTALGRVNPDVCTS